MNYNEILVEMAEKHHKFGIDTTFDADKKEVIFMSDCFCCKKEFVSKEIVLYCPQCMNMGRKH